ncbi:hypothetical protein O181_074512 [Austropuccinia psidii MF-1]|uniref:Uncharacterized protein n=1 Tax=Austropuccinia psidii MF-1 TaxID=1389203 RepID=A0A9Q3FD69_9BASI|nr:hypothetical protein [Austropuccinia psidii MF-1]
MGPRGKPTRANCRWVPKPQVGQAEPTLAKNTQKDTKTQVMDSGNHQRPPATFKGFSPQDQGNLVPAQWAQACRNQDWCIYGIIYHYAPFFLRNTTMIVSGTH